MKYYLLIISLIVGLTEPVLCQKKPLTVQKIYKIGDKFVSQLQVTSEIEMEVKETPMKTINQSITDYEYEVMSSNKDGSLNWEIRTKRLQINKVNHKGEKEEYDSHNVTRKSEDLQSKMNDCIAEAIIKMSTDDKNMIIYKISGLDQMIENMYYDLSEKEKLMLPKYKSAFKSIISDSTILNQFQETNGFYPKKPVKVGKKWSKKRKTKIMIPLNTEIEYTLKSRTDQEAIIETSTKI
jgi:Family of unknown function (DUF6263)